MDAEGPESRLHAEGVKFEDRQLVAREQAESGHPRHPQAVLSVCPSALRSLCNNAGSRDRQLPLPFPPDLTVWAPARPHARPLV